MYLSRKVMKCGDGCQRPSDDFCCQNSDWMGVVRPLDIEQWGFPKPAPPMYFISLWVGSGTAAMWTGMVRMLRVGVTCLP